MAPELSVKNFPPHLILGCEDIFYSMRAEVNMITRGVEVDWDAFFDQIFDCLVHLERKFPPSANDEQRLRERVEEMTYGDLLFESPGFEKDLELSTAWRARLYSVILHSALRIKERLLELGAYHQGVFPYTYRTMISDGCLFFSKNESIYDSQVLDPGFF
jgi:hypothetical protein